MPMRSPPPYMCWARRTAWPGAHARRRGPAGLARGRRIRQCDDRHLRKPSGGALNTITGALPPATPRRIDPAAACQWALLLLLAALAAGLAFLQAEPWQWQLPDGARLWGAGALLVAEAGLIGLVLTNRD